MPIDLDDHPRRTLIYQSLPERFPDLVVPSWYDDSVHRGWNRLRRLRE